MNDALQEQKIIADAARRALDDHLRPAFETVEAIYADRLKTIATQEPWAVDKIRSLAFAQKIAESVRGQIEALVVGGYLADDQLKRVRKIESMSPERRWRLGL